MKKMIFIISLFVLCIQFSAFAQKSRAGMFAGSLFSTMRGTVNSKKLDVDAKIGFIAGMLVDVPLKNHFSFQPALYYVQKGAVTQQPLESIQKPKITTELRYAELALNMVYNTNGAKANLYFGAGPSISFNLPSYFVTKSADNVRSRQNVVFGNTGPENFRGVDFGANLLAGYRFKGGVFIAANYSLGLRNLIPEGSLSTGDTKNSYVGLSLGWLVKNK